MALIDLTEIVMDPDFGDSFTIVRRGQVIDDHGRASQTEALSSAFGSVQAASGKTLELFPDLARTSGQVEIYTTTALRAAADGRAADDILWAGMRYTVVAVRDWMNWGAGWNLAIANQVDLLEAVQPGGNLVTETGDALVTETSDNLVWV